MKKRNVITFAIWSSLTLLFFFYQNFTTVINVNGTEYSVNNPSGIYVATKAKEDAYLDEALSDPNVVGLFIRYKWKDLEPAVDQFNWSLPVATSGYTKSFDEYIDLALKKGKKISIGIQTGDHAPAWIETDLGVKRIKFYESLHEMNPTRRHYAEAEAYPPWNKIYLERLDNLFMQIKKRLVLKQAYGQLNLFKITGINRESIEIRLPQQIPIKCEFKKAGEVSSFDCACSKDFAKATKTLDPVKDTVKLYEFSKSGSMSAIPNGMQWKSSDGVTIKCTKLNPAYECDHVLQLDSSVPTGKNCHQITDGDQQWLSAEYTPTKLVYNAWRNSILVSLNKYFPNKVLSMSVIDEETAFPYVDNLGNITMKPLDITKKLIAEGKSVLGGRFAIQANAITNNGGISEFVEELSNIQSHDGTPAYYTGYQLHQGISDNNNAVCATPDTCNDKWLRDVFYNARVHGTEFIEIYPRDVVNFTSAVKYGKCRLFSVSPTDNCD